MTKKIEIYIHEKKIKKLENDNRLFKYSLKI